PNQYACPHALEVKYRPPQKSHYYQCDFFLTLSKISCMILAIALLDLDHFKKINDTYLHTGGDIILKEVALQIKGQVRDVDIVARWGGEEFAVIFPNITLAEALSVLQRLQSVIERMRIAAYPNARVTVSIGVKQCIAMESSAELLKAADRALYQAKKQGRNRIICG